MAERAQSLALAAVALTSLAGCGEGRKVEDIETVTNASAAPPPPAGDAAARLASAPNASWINLSGQVVSTTPTSFVLDYGPANIIVEMDDWDWYKEGRALVAGDPVAVTGRIDRDLWEAKKIEASSVYARNLNTYFYASGADEEDLATNTVYVASIPGQIDATGTVTAIEGQEFTLGSVDGAIRVDMESLAAPKRPSVKIGDRVYVWGDLDLDLRERSELMARGIVLLARDRTKISGGTSPSAEGNMAATVPMSGNSQANKASAPPKQTGNLQAGNMSETAPAAGKGL